MDQNVFNLKRRGVELGTLSNALCQRLPSSDVFESWCSGQAIYCPGLLKDSISRFSSAIYSSHTLMREIVTGDVEVEAVSDMLAARVEKEFDLVSFGFNESDPQEITSFFFESLSGNQEDDLWLKLSWLSFDEDDASMRFRFSFGMDFYEIVADDLRRERLAARLSELIFPESAIVVESRVLVEKLQQVLQNNEPVEFVERIVYFNAPNGGAQFHHDYEPGHSGIVYAQLSGQTAWLALPKPVLVKEVASFLRLDELVVSQGLDDGDDAIEALINTNSDFIQNLFAKGYGYILEAGDVILLPQADLETCNWHTVFCLGDEEGEALSFALRCVRSD